MIADYLTEKKILLNVEGDHFQQVLRKMIEVSDCPSSNQILELISKREALMSTALGKGVAIPRAYVPGKTDTEIIVARCPNGTALKSHDSKPIYLIFLCLFEENDNAAEILAQSLRLLNDSSLRSGLQRASTPEEFIAEIKEWEKE